MKYHIEDKHSLDKKAEKKRTHPCKGNGCGRCRKKLKDNTMINTHVNDNHNSEVSIGCQDCGKLSQHNSTQSSHILTHTGANVFAVGNVKGSQEAGNI